MLLLYELTAAMGGGGPGGGGNEDAGRPPMNEPLPMLLEGGGPHAG